MDEKYIWPLVGVALGWLLSLVATSLKDRAEKKRAIGCLIAKLLVVHEQLQVLIAVSENFKDHVDGWEEYERMRKGVADRHFLEPASHLDSLRTAIDEIAGLYPIEALSLHGLIDILLKNKTASLVAMSQSKDLYVRGISVYEVALEASKSQIDKAIRRFARRHGWTTYLKLQLKYRESALNRKRAHGFLSRFSADSFSELNQFLSKAEAPNPSIERTSPGKPGDASDVKR